MRLHDDSFDISPTLVRELVAAQAPIDWASRPLRPAGNGTDNIMMRLGGELVVRLPQRAEASTAITKEAEWLPRIARALPVEVPRPRLLGDPFERYPSRWAVYDWIDGVEPSERSVADWAAFGSDLAEVVRALHAIDVSEVEPDESMRWYRGQPLSDFTADAIRAIDEIAALVERERLDLDVPRLREAWQTLSTTPQTEGSEVLLHGDLRAANLLVREGRLAAVIDFGTLSIGLPHAEHGPIWGFPAAARESYRADLGLSDAEWLLSLGWALLPGLTGLPYYWDTWPEFAGGCLDRVRLVLDETLPHADRGADCPSAAS